MSEYKYIIYGIPTAQGRTRFYRRGPFIGKYDPKDSKQAKDNIAAQLVAQKPHYSELPLEIEMWFFLPRPKSLSKKKVQFHTRKPDLSNLVKLTEDACKGILWRDDSQIVKVTAVKAYCHALTRPEPATELTVTEYEY